ncbi:MAG: hypothetical protein HKN06_04290 [Gammaproteobacteria bacterium]|nr:hypothetical protein [Gammaproteobacteria bacterium]
MKLLRGISASRLVCIGMAATLVALFGTANANEYLQSAVQKGSSLTRNAAMQSGNERSRNFLKAVRGENRATRGGTLCAGGLPNGSPDDGEECDDGDDSMPGDGCTACTIDANSDCTAAIAEITTANAVADGSFELNDGSWDLSNLSSGPSGNPEFNTDAFDGENLIRLVFTTDPAGLQDNFSQTVSIPADATMLEFAWWGVSLNAPACGEVGTELRVAINGVTQWSNVTDDPMVCESSFTYAWRPISIDVSAFAGTDVLLDIQYDFVVGTSVNLFVDDFRIDIPLEEPIPAVPSNCYVGVCGDGIVSSDEICDDGDDSVAGDGCTACVLDELSHTCFNTLVDTGFDVASGALLRGDDIIDGGLEQGGPNPDWAETGTVFDPICSEGSCGAALANDGDFFAWFGGVAAANAQTLSQETVISTGASTLEFDLLVGICDSTADVLRVNIIDDGGASNTVYERFCAETGVYLRQVIDLTTAPGGPYNTGGTYTVEIASETFATNAGNSNQFVDNIAISYDLATERAPLSTVCVEQDTLCETPAGRGPGGLPEQFNDGTLGVMTTFEAGTLSGPNTWTTSADQWTAVGDPSGCGTADLSVANWPGGNLMGTSGEVACADSDGGAEALAAPDAEAACLDAADPTAACQTRTWLCTPSLDLSSTTSPILTLMAQYDTATQDFDTDSEQLRILVGNTFPSVFSMGSYAATIADPEGNILLGSLIPDENSTTLVSQIPAPTYIVDLHSFVNPDPGLVLNNAAGDPLIDPISGENVKFGDESIYVCLEYAGVYSWFAQVDNVALRADDCAIGDMDRDRVSDAVDNCTEVANADQNDTDLDGFGNRCDGDFDNDCTTGLNDLAALRPVFPSSAGDGVYENLPQADLDGDGAIGLQDLAIFRELFLLPPGPGSADCVPPAVAGKPTPRNRRAAR